MTQSAARGELSFSARVIQRSKGESAIAAALTAPANASGTNTLRIGVAFDPPPPIGAEG
jgi:hypothetical protein